MAKCKSDVDRKLFISVSFKDHNSKPASKGKKAFQWHDSTLSPTTTDHVSTFSTPEFLIPNPSNLDTSGMQIYAFCIAEWCISKKTLEFIKVAQLAQTSINPATTSFGKCVSYLLFHLESYHQISKTVPSSSKTTSSSSSSLIQPDSIPSTSSNVVNHISVLIYIGNPSSHPEPQNNYNTRYGRMDLAHMGTNLKRLGFVEGSTYIEKEMGLPKDLCDDTYFVDEKQSDVNLLCLASFETVKRNCSLT